MNAEAVAGLLSLGLPGIVILGLAVWGLKKDAKVDEVNEKRIAEGREAIKAIEQNTNTLETLTEVLRDRKAG